MQFFTFTGGNFFLYISHPRAYSDGVVCELSRGMLLVLVYEDLYFYYVTGMRDYFFGEFLIYIITLEFAT